MIALRLRKQGLIIIVVTDFCGELQKPARSVTVSQEGIKNKSHPTPPHPTPPHPTPPHPTPPHPTPPHPTPPHPTPPHPTPPHPTVSETVCWETLACGGGVTQNTD